MSNKSTQLKTALVTGASSGIGLELSRILAADGYQLILTARRQDELTHIAKELADKYQVTVKTIPLDLAEYHAADQLWEKISKTDVSIDVLINNAGFGYSGQFSEADLDMTDRMIQLNVAAHTKLIRLVLPNMIHNKDGRILNVASLAGFQPAGPGMATYYATKSYVLSLSRALQVELRGTGVTVTALCPGPTATGFEDVAGAEFSRALKLAKPATAKSVALLGYRGLKSGKTVVVPGLINKLMAFLGELHPRYFALQVNRFMLSKIHKS